jgi:hypothetical protein
VTFCLRRARICAVASKPAAAAAASICEAIPDRGLCEAGLLSPIVLIGSAARHEG